MNDTRDEGLEISATKNQIINPVEIIEIDDSDNSDTEEVKVTANNANLKRQHFFPDDGHVDTPMAQSTTKQSADLNQTKTLSPESQYALDYPYSNRSSAYVQHISEACTLIMSDARWRTCNKISCSCLKGHGEYEKGPTCRGKTLFSWEDGDDLSAVKAFMSLYDPEEKDNLENTDTDQLIFERAMHLYSRMFHRKGPYFDLSDLYDRYYAPKRKNQQQPIEIQTEHPEDTLISCEESGTSNDLSSHLSDCVKKVSANQRIQSFFTPKASSSGRSTPNASAVSSNKSKAPDELLIQHQTALQLLFTDIHRLLSMGLVRTFESEYECGSVAGHVNAGSNRGSFLLASERREVLSKLGGAGKSPKSRSSTSESDSNTNEILEQMQKQKSMFSSTSCGNETRNQNNDKQLLPVRKHVDYVLLRKFAVKIASMSSSSANPRKADVEAAYQLIRTVRINTLKHHVSTVCLREAPLTTLRRVMRLFLCASGGPGNMRGDGTNGWLHIPPTLHCTKTPNLWHNVVYPGLSSRLGISSYELKNLYEEQHSSEAIIARVFPGQCYFKLFEVGVEVRSFIDRAMEAYEIDRSNRRRKQLATAENDSTVLNSAPLCQAHDQFDILHVDGRRIFVQRVFALYNVDTADMALKTFELIESDINSLHSDDVDDFATDTERMIVAIAITCHRVLQARLSMSHITRDLEALCRRPW